MPEHDEPESALKEVDAAKKAEITHKGIRVKPGAIEFADGKKLPVVGETPTSYVTLQDGSEVHAPKQNEGTHYKITKPHKIVSKHITTKKDAHFAQHLNQEQQDLIDGIDLEHPERSAISEGIHSAVVYEKPYTMKGRSGKKIFVKHSPDEQTHEDIFGSNEDSYPMHHREEAFYRIGKDVFGIDLPTTVSVQTKHGPAIVQEWTHGYHLPYGEKHAVPQNKIEQAMVLDYVLANEDRHDGNFKIGDMNGEGDHKLHLFDHGMTFTKAPTGLLADGSGKLRGIHVPMYVQNKDQSFQADTKKWILGLDHGKMNEIMKSYGVPEERKNEAIARLLRLKDVVQRGKRVTPFRLARMLNPVEHPDLDGDKAE